MTPSIRPTRLLLLLWLSTPSAALGAPQASSSTKTAAASMPASAAASQPIAPPATRQSRSGAQTCEAPFFEQLKAALQRHPVVDAGRASADALRGRGRAEAAWKDPSVSIEARGMPITEPWNIGRTPMGGVAMGVSATVPWLPRRWALERARAHEAEALEARTGERTLDLEQALLGLLVEDELLAAKHDVLTDRASLLASLAEVASANATVGVGSQADAVLLEAKASQVLALRSAIDARRDALRARWAAVVPDVAWPACRLDEIDVANDAANDAANAEEDALEQRPFLRALKAEERAADARASAALQAWIPEPTVRAGYVWRPDYGSFDGMDFFGGMVSIPLPISPGARLGSAATAAAQTRRADAERRAFLRDARGRQNALLQEIAAEQRQLDELVDNTRPIALAASAVAQSAYAAGEGSVAAIVEAERLVLDLDLSALEARARQARLRLALRRLEGGVSHRTANPAPR